MTKIAMISGPRLSPQPLLLYGTSVATKLEEGEDVLEMTDRTATADAIIAV